MIRMTAEHAQWPIEDDAIFAIAGRAKQAEEKFGRENVINATLGAIMDDDGGLVCLKTVYDELKGLPNARIAAYAQLAGQPEFLTAIEKACFAEHRPNGHIRSVATPGGTGGIKHAVWNYTNEGDDILVADWFWSPYKTISEEGKRGLRNFRLFNEEGGFDIRDFDEKFTQLVKDQKRALTIINTPAHNPTGYSLSDEEWDKVIEVLKKNAQDKENKIILVVDTAYIDYAGEGTKQRAFFKKFEDLPENVFVMIAFSMSKGYTMYGLRMGALIGISSVEDIAVDFYYGCLHAGRANWSNGTRAAMETLIEIDKDDAKLKAYEDERNHWRDVLRNRANVFVKAAEEVGLEILPYRDGFFTTIPYHHPKQLVEKLTESNMFAVALKKGVRFAICAVDEKNCAKAPAIIKKAMDELKANKRSGGGCCGGGKGGGCCGKHK
ncbi:MAG: aminotransferase class I/II-fold pyridoxal phosphate-dependent enzyme [Peptostreptococcaceae bacterium]|nr:aminotransferase class I/II-fold pyridoxal phosphate-dependent enzyme [Peptostreptococcaceae bacterium]